MIISQKQYWNGKFSVIDNMWSQVEYFSKLNQYVFLINILFDVIVYDADL